MYMYDLSMIYHVCIYIVSWLLICKQSLMYFYRVHKLLSDCRNGVFYKANNSGDGSPRQSVDERAQTNQSGSSTDQSGHPKSSNQHAACNSRPSSATNNTSHHEPRVTSGHSRQRGGHSARDTHVTGKQPGSTTPGSATMVTRNVCPDVASHMTHSSTLVEFCRTCSL